MPATQAFNARARRAASNPAIVVSPEPITSKSGAAGPIAEAAVTRAARRKTRPPGLTKPAFTSIN